MKNKILISLFILIGLHTASAQKYSTKGSEFIIAFMPNFNLPQLTLYLSSDEACVATVILPGRAPIIVNLGANSANSVDVTAAYGNPTNQNPVYTLPTESNTINGKSIRVTSTKPISVYSFNTLSTSTDATLVLPTDALDEDYRAFSSNVYALQNLRSQISVVGLKNGTTVEITPTANIITLPSGAIVRPRNVPFTITLNDGQVYFAQSDGDLTGTRTRVTSSNCAKIALFSGHQRTNLPIGVAGNEPNGRDHLYEQMMPMSSWGTNFIVPLPAQAIKMKVRIMSANNTIPTTITTNRIPSVLTIPASVPFIEIDNVTSTFSITSSQPISVAEYAFSLHDNSGNPLGFTGGIGDPFLMNIPPLEQGIDRITFNAFSPTTFAPNPPPRLYTTIITPSIFFNSTKLDNINLTAHSPLNTSTLNVSGVNYTVANFLVNPGNHTITSPTSGSVLASLYGLALHESYGMIAGASVNNINQQVFINGTKNDTVVCPGGQVAFRGFSTDSTNILSWKWVFQDGQVATNPTNVTVFKSFPDTGSFRVNLILEKRNGCSFDTVESTVNVRTNIAITAPIPEGCPGSTLTLRSTLTGGNAPYTYTWTPVAANGIIGATTADSLDVKHDVTGIYTYKLAVQDVSGCIASTILTVNYFEPPAITPMPTVFGCSGENAKLTPTVTKGKPPYNFQWIAQNTSSDSTILSGKLTNSLEVSTTIEGTYNYKLTVTDANGCQDSSIINYTVVPKPSFKNDAENPIVSCFEPNRPPTTIGDKITIAGGVPPYTFDWKEAGGGTSTIIGSQTTLETQVKPDITTTYILTVTDNNPNKKCPFTYTLIVEVRPVPDAPPSTDQIICACDATSIAQLGGEAKCGVQPYNYEWSPTTGLSNPTSTTTARTTAKPTQTTTYILKVTDGQARIAFDTVVVTVVPCPTVGDTSIIICDVTVPQTLGVKVSGVPLDSMKYDWSPSIGLSAKNIENPTLTLPDSNATYNYTVNVQDKFGCPATATVTVKTSQTLSVTTTSSKPCPQKICRGIDSVELSSVIIGGQPPLDIEWTSSLPVADYPKKGPKVFARPLETTMFTSTVTDANGCTSISTIEVCVDPVPNVFPGDADTICTGSSITLGKPSTCGEKFVYSWAASPFLVHTDSKNPEAIFTPTSPGTYTLSLTVQDQDGGALSKSTTGSVTIVALENPKSIITPNPNVLCECTVLGNRILATGTRGRSPYSFIWSVDGVEQLRENQVDSSSLPLTVLSKTTTFEVRIIDANGCESSDSTTVIINLCPVVTVNSPTICECETVQLNANVVGNPSDFVYKWTNADGTPAQNFSDTTVSNPFVTPKSSSQYLLTVTDKTTGCVSTVNAGISVGKDEAPRASFSIPSLISDPRNKQLSIPIVVDEFTSNLQCFPKEMQFSISYNENLFDPNPTISQGTNSGVTASIISNTTEIVNGTIHRKITVRCSPIPQLKQGDVLMSLKGAALIGDPGFTDVTMSNIEWTCGSGITSPDTSKGLLTLDSLCLLPIGTKRLLTFNNGATVLAMVPNPTTGFSNISLRRYDGEEVRMSVYSALGDELYSTVWQKSDAIGEEIATYPILLNRESGVYHIVLRAATGISTEQLVIVK
ncbi:MAG: PKD domain-containing protein [Ignavibacteria bacterium]|nr:PKD domain-containing protein [Ignavibacteria bacterium]